MYGVNAHMYRTEDVNGVRIKVDGPVGGWCSLISHELYDQVGGFAEQENAFWLEDGVLLDELARFGYRPACLGPRGRPRERPVLLADPAREAGLLACLERCRRAEGRRQASPAGRARRAPAERAARVVPPPARAPRLGPPLQRRTEGRRRSGASAVRRAAIVLDPARARPLGAARATTHHRYDPHVMRPSDLRRFGSTERRPDPCVAGSTATCCGEWADQLAEGLGPAYGANFRRSSVPFGHADEPRLSLHL